MNTTSYFSQTIRTLALSLKHAGLCALMAASLVACGGGQSEVSPEGPSAGTANFSKYVAFGDAYTAGYANGGVYRAGQLASYPNLLAQQFALAGGGAFAQPLYSDAQKDGTGYLKLRTTTTAFLKTEFFGPGSSGFAGGIVGSNGTLPLYAKHVGANNNLGVADLKVADLQTAGYGLSNPTAFNPHFERLLSSANSTATYSAYAASAAAGATYFSIWLGNHDVLAYANAGGASSSMTSVATFTASLQSFLNTVTAVVPNGMIVNIPQFTTYTASFRTFSRTSLLASLTPTPPGGIFIQDGTGATRSATDNDLFLLSAQARYALIGSTSTGAGVPFPYGLHPNNPLPNAEVLDSTEVSAIVARINDLNAVIAAQAAAKGLILIDLNALGGVLDIANTTGFPSGTSTTATFSTSFNSGGIFSLDGFSLTPVGHAILANEMIKAINKKHSATLPLLNLSSFIAP